MRLLIARIAIAAGATLIWLAPVAAGKTFEPRESAITQNKMSQLQTALRNYITEYGRFPHADLKSMFAILGGEDRDGKNPKRIVFYEYRQSKTFLFWTRDPGDFDEQGRFLDGWQRPFQFGIGAGGFPIRMRSLGKNGRDDDGLRDDRELVIMPPLPQANALPPQPLPAIAWDVGPEAENAFFSYLLLFLCALLLAVLGVFVLLLRRKR